MTSGEFVGRQQPTDISQRLESLTLDETRQWCDELHADASRQWERCQGSFDALFNRLNLFTATEISQFDILVEKAEDVPTETYIHLWKDQEGDYNTCQLLRYNGEILDRGQTETFSDTYKYQFGPNNNLVATIKLRDDITGIQTTNANGQSMYPSNEYETSVLIAALESHVLPSLEQTKATLARLWSALHSIEDGTL